MFKNNKNVPTKYIYWTENVIIVLFNGHWKPQSWYIDNLRTTSVHDKRKNNVTLKLKFDAPSISHRYFVRTAMCWKIT